MSDTTVAPAAPKQHSRTSTWLNRFFFILVVIALPAAWKFDYIGGAWLNRIGIIMNFLAGFLLAPELLGLHRVQAIEATLENTFSRFTSYANRQERRLLEWVPGIQKSSALLLIVGFIFIYFNKEKFYLQIMVIYNYELHGNIMLLYVAYLVLAIIIGLIYWYKQKEVGSFFGVLIGLHIGLFFLMLLPIFGIIMLLAFLIRITMSIMSKITSYFINVLQGDNRLRSILIYWGIIFFIVGNLVQFIASF